MRKGRSDVFIQRREMFQVDHGLTSILFNNEGGRHLFTFVYFPTWVIIVYNLWSTNNIEKDTVKSTDIRKYLQSIWNEHTQLQQQ